MPHSPTPTQIKRHLTILNAYLAERTPSRAKVAYVLNALAAFVDPSTSRIATEFPTEEALKTYLKEHPDADPKKHTVKKEDGNKGDAHSGAPKGYNAGYVHDRGREVMNAEHDVFKTRSNKVQIEGMKKVKKPITDLIQSLEKNTKDKDTPFYKKVTELKSTLEDLEKKTKSIEDPATFTAAKESFKAVTSQFKDISKALLTAKLKKSTN